MKLFQYSASSSWKIHSHKLFWYFCHSSSQLRLFTSFLWRQTASIFRLKPYVESWILPLNYLPSTCDVLVSDGLMQLEKTGHERTPTIFNVLFPAGSSTFGTSDSSARWSVSNELNARNRFQLFGVFQIHSQWSKNSTVIPPRSEASLSAFWFRTFITQKQLMILRKLTQPERPCSWFPLLRRQFLELLCRTLEFQFPLQFCFWPNAGF